MDSLGRLRSRLPSPSLAAKLILFCTLLTVVAACVAILALSFEMRTHTKGLLAESLSHHQKTISSLQQRSFQELLRTSTLMTDSPTLRAAMETYQSESGRLSRVRADLLATIQNEASKVFAGLGGDLLVVTDGDGRVLAASVRSGQKPEIGDDVSGHDVVRHALEQDAPVGAPNFAVLDLGGEYFRVGSVPIVLQGFIIGTLTLGERIDQTFVDRLQGTFDGDFLVAVDHRLVASTLPRRDADDVDLCALSASHPGGTQPPVVTRLADEEYVTATLPLGSDGRGHEVTLYLLHSLTRALGQSNRLLLLVLLTGGSSVVLLVGVVAWRISRSVLHPLDRFVAFMRSVASSGDHARRFEGTTACIEVETLNEAYIHLMASLEAHERRLIESTREDLNRLMRLKESEKLAALGRMLSSAAHEINNPLTGVMGHIELLLGDPGLDPEVRRRLGGISRDGARVVALVRNLLRIAHRDTGAKTVVDVHQVIRQTADVRRHDFVSAGIRLELDLAPDPIHVLGGELELHQVFLNLINNALDALAEVPGVHCLTIRTSVTHEQTSIVFEDDGPGMEDPALVFDHFYTTKEVGKGTGLGLSICCSIVQAHGGQIGAENHPEGGARFTVTLPLAAAREETPVAIATGPLAALDTPDRFTASVLIVDDEPTIVDLQREILESLGAAVVGVGSGSEAIDILRQRPFDLIVTDLRMPGGVSGQDLFRWVQVHQPESSRGFVFVTGDTAASASHEFLQSVGARCLLKPFSMAEYVETLRETFHEARPHG